MKEAKMELIEKEAGPMTTCTDSGNRIQIVAGDADCIRVFMRRQDNQTAWRVLGSQDQRDEIFLAAWRNVPVTYLDGLTLRGKRLLPEYAAWTEIGVYGLDLFTNDSCSVVLGLRDN
jgi:hypothetical protein